MKILAHATVEKGSRIEFLRRMEEVDNAPPEGAELVARWFAASGNEMWMVIDGADSSVVAEYFLEWANLSDISLTPVVSDDEIDAALASRGVFEDLSIT